MGTSLLLDVVLEIAARSDPATLVRCAATCREARRRVANDPTFHGRLRLRQTDRFVLPLLRGHLIEIYGYKQSNKELHLVDVTAAKTKVRPLTGSDGLPSGPWDEYEAMAQHNGLLLLRKTNRVSFRQEIRVCDLATSRGQTLPPEPLAFGVIHTSDEIQYTLFAGDGDGNPVGRPFQVIKAHLVSTDRRSYLEIQTFSSELDAWGPCTEIPATNISGGRYRSLGRTLIVGDVLYWLLTNGSKVFFVEFHVKEARLMVTKLPASIPHADSSRCLLATASAGGSPIVLVADDVEISSWVQTGDTTETEWKKGPQPVIKNEEILRFSGMDALTRISLAREKLRPQLQWFAERSGVVLIRVADFCIFWLDLQSKKVVRWFWDSSSLTLGCPYDMDLSSWVPTFNSTIH